MNRIIEIRYSSTAGIEQVINEILENINVEYAEPSYIEHGEEDVSHPYIDHIDDVSNDPYVDYFSYSPDDPVYKSGEQYYLKQVHAPEAWNVPIISTTPVVIAILESGSQIDHEDLAANIYYNTKEIPDNGKDDDDDGYIDNYGGWDFVGDDINNPDDSKGKEPHGTHVSGLASAVTNNGKGIASIANNHAKLLLLQTRDDTGTGHSEISAQAIKYAVDHGANIINCSFGSNYSNNSLKDVIEYAIANNCLVIAVAGNDGGNKLDYPAAYEGVFSVSKSDLKSWFSNYGVNISLSAPGENIYSTSLGNRYKRMSGTSMATPIVSSAAALVKARFPSWTMKQVADQLEASADHIDWNKHHSYKYLIGKLGSGRLNVYRALTETKPLPAPIVNSNSPVCAGNLLALSTSTNVENASYSWVGPNGFKSNLQKLTI